ncbi:HAD family hydrolase [Paenibacillus sp. IHBB 10380]|uniref:HAD family hydrolase n=1 Tax=Paenibacillus sp. IHBB 10380 TaxID=1566358 RepID=UPI0005CFB1A2|nr:HAD family hydrolase [Paenibacillus sp. IHBB 10380]AJS60180.1 hydrolase [Paenibacillus sp. IHBB 10380]
MIYASDLDQTLIYSTRSVGLALDSPLIMAAETVNGKITSYISIQACSILTTMAKEMEFIPVTTRTMEQYNRIELFREVIQPKYAITSNGGNILFDGIPDLEWNQFVHDDIVGKSASANEVKTLFDQIGNDDWILGERFCDELFFSIVINREKMPLDEVHQVSKEIRNLGWEVSVQGRKIYLVPISVSKSAALSHLQQRIGADIIVASGDSLLDRCLLDYATHPIAPKHGELYREELRFPGTMAYSFTSTSGVLAADEIMKFVSKVSYSNDKVMANKIERG